jgi:hypothetical protein
VTLFQDIETRATAKAGPLPVWGWAVGLTVAGYLAYRYYVSKKTPDTVDANVATDSSAQPDDGTGTQFGPFYQVNYQPPADTPPAGIPVVTPSKATYVKNARNNKTYKIVGNKITAVDSATYAAAADKRTQTPTFAAVMDLYTGIPGYSHPIYELFGGTKVKLSPAMWKSAQQTEKAKDIHTTKASASLKVPDAADRILY